MNKCCMNKCFKIKITMMFYLCDVGPECIYKAVPFHEFLHFPCKRLLVADQGDRDHHKILNRSVHWVPYLY